MQVEFQPARSDDSPARELLSELNELLDRQYPGRASRPGSVTTPDEMVPPEGAFLFGLAAGRPVAIGGLRRLTSETCEIKRMYVVPDARSRGVGRALLKALENAAAELGYTRARLDAGPAQQHSRRLFAGTGYAQIRRYNDNHIADYFAEKRLTQ
ncbi:MAG: GNAT family N-acetyltransferase [Thermoleophilaceae bacterium]|nr:GNAT family N-acetyltransferase [Thermoleophilaceae bacterium]